MLIPEVIFIYDRRLKAEGFTQRKYAELICCILLVTTQKGFSKSHLCARFSATYVHL